MPLKHAEPKPKPQAKPKSKSERLVVVNETKVKCIEHGLTDDIATTVLFGILDTYHMNGTVCHTELNMKGLYDRPRKYVIKLFNDVSKRDIVLIRTIDNARPGSEMKSDS